MKELSQSWKEWSIVEEIGKGSYGTVYLIEQQHTGELSALKVISIPKNQNADDHLREIAAMESLKDCPNIVKIQEHHLEEDEEDGTLQLMIRMEYLQSFDDYLSEHTVDELMIVKIGLDLLNGLEKCEERGILHRDIKPSNILVTEDGTFKLGDFGTAKQAMLSNQTIKGTFDYMAPEVFQGKKYDHQADIYSLGLILYEHCNQGRGPFVNLEKKIIYGKDKEEAFEKRMVQAQVPPPVDGGPILSHILQRALAFDPKLRYQTAKEMKQDLLEFQKGCFNLLKKEKARKRRQYFLQIMARKKEVLAGAVIVAMILFSIYYKYDQLQHVDPSNQKIRYELKDGVLTISGKGKMTDSNKELPWYKKKDKVKKVQIEEGITYVGERAFQDCDELETVILPETMEDLGDEAFADCDNLKSVTWPQDLDPKW